MSLPLNYDNVVAILAKAAKSERGTDSEVAEAQLKVWNSAKGYHYLLQQVYNDMSQPLQIRWLAVICLKNGIEQYWRPTRLHAIDKEEKAKIRQNLFNQLDESNNQLTIQNAHIVARICRIDFPGEWPTVFNQMTDIFESVTGLSETLSMVRINNLLVIMNQVLKVLSSVRIGRARSAMRAKMPIVVPYLIKYYHHFFNLWTTNYDPTTMEVGYMCLKNIRRAVVDGYETPHTDHTISEFFETSLQHFQKLLILHESTQLEMLERYLKCYLKLYFNLASDNVVSFLLFPSSKNILLTLLSLLQQKAETIYNIEERDGSEFWEQIGVKTMLIVKKVTSFGFHQGPTVLGQKTNKVDFQRAMDLVKQDIFTQKLVENLVKMLMQSYLKLRPCDVEAWSLEPEEWVTEELQMNWEFQIRPCAENYFQDLVIYFKDYLSGYIMNAIETTLSKENDVLSEDAILTVFQLSYESISSQCSFDQMLPNYFIPLALRSDSDERKIIKRRVCRIISEWVDAKCSKDTRIATYNLLNTLMEPPADIVVSLTVIQTLQHLVDDWEFRKNVFQPFIDPTVSHMLSLLAKLTLPESKIFVLKVLSLIIERSNPFMSDQSLLAVIDMVPKMWEASSGPNETIIKNSLLRVLRELTTSLNSKSDMIHTLVMPLIPSCCTQGSQYYSLLCEDGFDVWAAVLKQLPVGKPIPQELYESWFPLIVPGLANWTEILPLILNIIRSYTLINPSLFETEYGLQIFQLLAQYLPTMRDESVFLSSQLTEILILQPATTQVIANLYESGMFNSMMHYLMGRSEIATCEIKTAIPILRLVLADPQFFIFKLMSSIKGQELGVFFHRFMRSLLGLMKMTYDSKTRKLFLLALISLYDPQYFVKRIPKDPGSDIDYQLEKLSPEDGVALVLTTNFNAILSHVAKFLDENQEQPSGDSKKYHQQGPYDDEDLRLCQTDEEQRDEGEDPDNEYVQEFRVPDSGERIRFTELVQTKDPVHSVNLKQFVQFKMSQLTGSVENYEGLINSVSKETMDDLQLQYNR